MNKELDYQKYVYHESHKFVEKLYNRYGNKILKYCQFACKFLIMALYRNDMLTDFNNLYKKKDMEISFFQELLNMKTLNI